MVKVKVQEEGKMVEGEEQVCQQVEGVGHHSLEREGHHPLEEEGQELYNEGRDKSKVQLLATPVGSTTCTNVS